LCNLTEVVARPEDTAEILRCKVRIAVILGTLQSTLTNFRYVRKIWKTNAEEERLLGVSITGIQDNKLLRTPGPELDALLDDLTVCAVNVNKAWADKLGINQSVAVTCVKPSGTVSRLVNASPGLHTSYGEFLILNIREDNKSPVCTLLKQSGVPWEPSITNPNDTTVFSFPVKAPEGAVISGALTAIQQLELALTYKEHWTEHNPSCTVYIKEHEWLEVGAWVFKHMDRIGGVAFLPHTNHIYKQAPYTRITESEYILRTAAMPKIDWELLGTLESEDFTTSSQELACSGGQCDITGEP
jgi:ribonucleoside-diphosphate reductase alpha chain